MKKCEILAEELNKLDYGVTVSHLEVSGMIEIEYGIGQYYSTVKRAIRLLESPKYGKKVEIIHGVGYRIILPDEYTDNALSDMKKGFNHISRGYNTILSAPEEHMSDEGRKVHRAISDRAMILYSTISETKTQLNQIRRKPHAFSLSQGGVR